MQQKIVFTKGIDSDTSPEVMPDGVSKFRLNARVFSSENGEEQSAESAKGNTLVPFTLPLGVNTIIGANEDKKNKKIYYFLHNDLDNHLILEYNSVTNVVAKVFQDSINIVGGLTNILNFQLTNLITGIDVVELDSDNHLLYWTDGYVSTSNSDVYNEPKKINIEKGKYFMAGDFINGYKTPFDPEILYRIKQPSLCGPTYEWVGPVEQFEATSVSAIQTHVLIDGFVDVKFDTDVYDPNNQFNTGTYSWTVLTSGTYNLQTVIFLRTNAASGLFCNAKIEIFVNGISVGTVTYLSIPLAGGNYGLNLIGYALTSGDVVKVVVACITGGVAILDFKGVTFKSALVYVTKRVNNLFKQYPVFKTQFVYDDNDVSSWSPWSPYVFPNVIHDATTCNDIITQDDSINVIVETGIGIVTRIRVAVKMLGTQLINSVVQPLEFSLIVELDKKNLQIADNSTYSFPFLNEGNYTPIFIKESIKLFDSVPLASQAQELIIDGRITDGLITEGQNPVGVDMIMNLSYINIGTLPNWATAITPASFLKSGGIYKYGIVYSDHAGRVYNANIQRGASTVLLPNGKYGTTLYVPFLTEIGYNAPHAIPNADMAYVPQVNMQIYNEPPAWATHYFIIRSQNQAMTQYFQFVAQDVSYVDILGAPAAPAVATNLIIDILNITDRYQDENGTSSLVYDFTPGDRIRFIANRSGAGPSFTQIGPFFSFNDTEITSYDSATGLVYIKMTSDIPIAPAMGYGVLFEIYTPARNVINDNEFVYEIGECYPLINDIHGNLVHSFDTDQLINSFTSQATVGTNVTVQLALGHGIVFGDNVKIVDLTSSIYGVVTAANPTNVVVSTIGFTLTVFPSTGSKKIYKSADGVLNSGDCFRIFQNMPWVNTGTVRRMYMYVENMNISNLWVSNAWDYARPNRVDESAGRITRPSTCIWSESFIPETLINGLSTVYDTNFQTYEQRYGGIYLLVNKNLFLDVYQELKVSRVPIQQSVLNSTQGDQLVTQSAEVLSVTPMYYQGEFGIGKHPESHSEYAERDYWIDVNRGVVLRKSNDGITPISDLYKQHVFFNNKCKDVLAYPNGKINIYGVYDVKFGEYIISFENIVGSVSAPPFVGDTIAFNEYNNSWSTHYSYIPEYMCSNGIGIVSFKDGAIYTHNTNNLYSNFYGVQYSIKLWFFSNLAPSNIKVFDALSLEALHSCNAIIETPITEENLTGQTTGLFPANFQRKEGWWYSDILRDDTTPNIVPFPAILPNARFEGNVLRGAYALIKLEYLPNSYNKFFACNVRVINSPRSNE